MFGKKSCYLCGGKIVNGRCVECGLDNERNAKKKYRLNESSRDRKKEIMLAGEYDERIKTKRYASGRDGNLERVNDGTKVRFVRRYEQT